MRLADLDYDLPEEAIAQTPLENRADSKLLWLHRRSGEIEDRSFSEVANLLQAGDLLVLNDTRVSAIRLSGRKPSGGQVELLLLEEVSPGRFVALARPGKRLRPGASVDFEGGLTAKIEEDLSEGRKQVAFTPCEDLSERLSRIGTVPLPPYIHAGLPDPERYQTVYGKTGGSAAAPTAGLHFTPELLSALVAKGVEIASVTLDVGLDTFRPITAADPTEHEIHGEKCRLPVETKRAIESASGRIIAVGTTAVRTLETFAIGDRRVESGVRDTRLFITPGYRFRVVDGMFTNFHLPRTTMLLMIAAMAGREEVLAAYQHALAGGYRFLSFGDSMLIL